MGELLVVLLAGFAIVCALMVFVVSPKDKSFIKVNNCDSHGGAAVAVNYNHEYSVFTCKDGEQYSIYIKDLGR